jgi:hypothetical protein
MGITGKPCLRRPNLIASKEFLKRMNRNNDLHVARRAIRQEGKFPESLDRLVYSI